MNNSVRILLLYYYQLNCKLSIINHGHKEVASNCIQLSI